MHIQSCFQGACASQYFYNFYDDHKLNNIDRWLLMYSLAKAVYNQALFLIYHIYKKKENLFKFDDWKVFLKTEIYVKQKNLIYTFLKSYEKFYFGVESFHEK